MAVTIKQTEAAPEAYPDAPAGLSTAAAALSAAMIWQRLESYTACRWAARGVVWIVEGPGEWLPSLKPATITTVEIWAAGAWQDVTPDASPLGGYWLTGNGPYRFTGTAGSDVDVPASVQEAFRRLAEYMAADPGTPGATSSRTDVIDIESVTIERSASWMARAMQNSGAGDLLRGYRHV